MNNELNASTIKNISESFLYYIRIETLKPPLNRQLFDKSFKNNYNIW